MFPLILMMRTKYANTEASIRKQMCLFTLTAQQYTHTLREIERESCKVVKLHWNVNRYENHLQVPPFRTQHDTQIILKSTDFHRENNRSEVKTEERRERNIF